MPNGYKPCPHCRFNGKCYLSFLAATGNPNHCPANSFSPIPKQREVKMKSTTTITKEELDVIIVDYLTNVRQVNAGKVVDIHIDCSDNVVVTWEG